jgi:hypothetical protein
MASPGIRRGRWLFGLDGVALLQYRFDATGAITPNDPPRAVGSEGHQLLALRTHPSGRWVYSIEEAAVGTFAFDPRHRHPGLAGLRLQRPCRARRSPGRGLALHGSGRFLYALGSATDTQSRSSICSPSTAPASRPSWRGRRGTTFIRSALGSLQAPLVLGDLLIVGGEGVAGPHTGLPVLCVYRIAADGTLTTAGDPVVLRPAATARVNFLLAAEGGALGPRN